MREHCLRTHSALLGSRHCFVLCMRMALRRAGLHLFWGSLSGRTRPVLREEGRADGGRMGQSRQARLQRAAAPFVLVLRPAFRPSPGRRQGPVDSTCPRILDTNPAGLRPTQWPLAGYSISLLECICHPASAQGPGNCVVTLLLPGWIEGLTARSYLAATSNGPS